MNNYKKIHIDKIKPDTNQPRKYFDSAKISEMAQSFRTQGQINAIEVDENYMIVTGETRWRAAKKAGFKEIDCKILSGISKKDRLFRQIVENIHNSTMTPVEIADALLRMLKIVSDEINGRRRNIKKGKTRKDLLYNRRLGRWSDAGISELSRRTGIPKTSILGKLDILKQTEALKKMIHSGEVPYTVIQEIDKIRDKKLQKKIEKKVIRKEIETRDGVRAIANAIARNPDDAEKISSHDYSKCDTTEEIIHEVRKNTKGFVTDEEEVKFVSSLFDPAKEIMSIGTAFAQWVNKYPIDKIPKESMNDVARNLVFIMSMIKDYLGGADKDFKKLSILEEKNG